MVTTTRSTARTRARAAFVDDYLSYLLARASHVVYKEFDGQVREAGLAPLEWRVLATLSDGDGLTIGELAGKVLAKQPTLTKLVQRMVKAGLVRRTDDGADLRRTLVFETAQGRKLVEGLLARAKRHEAVILRPFAARKISRTRVELRDIFRRSEGLRPPSPLFP